MSQPIFKVRISGFKDYVAMDRVDAEGNILDTPIYITKKTPVEIHTGKPSAEQPPSPSHYDDFNDKWLISLGEDGNLYLKWLCGFSGGSQATKIPAEDLLDFKYGRVRQPDGTLKHIQ